MTTCTDTLEPYIPEDVDEEWLAEYNAMAEERRRLMLLGTSLEIGEEVIDVDLELIDLDSDE